MLATAARSAKALRFRSLVGASRYAQPIAPFVAYITASEYLICALHRTFSTTRARREETEQRPTSLNVFTDEENMLRESGA